MTFLPTLQPVWAHAAVKAGQGHCMMLRLKWRHGILRQTMQRTLVAKPGCWEIGFRLIFPIICTRLKTKLLKPKSPTNPTGVPETNANFSFPSSLRRAQLLYCCVHGCHNKWVSRTNARTNCSHQRGANGSLLPKGFGDSENRP